MMLQDLGSGQVLFSRHPDRRRPIASLTKIMTALVVMAHTQPTELAMVTAGAVAGTGSLLGLQAGERLSVGHLLYALLLQSANDAAMVLAEHVGGTIPGFIRMMNEEAADMGLRDTRFFSPSGLDDRGYSTARDVATLTRRAYRLPGFAAMVRTKIRTIPAPAGPPRRVQNRNALLWLYDGAIGVKTGFTEAAGYCLVAAAEREGRRVLSVVLGEESNAFDDSASLLNFGFSGFQRRALASPGDYLGRVRVEGSGVEVVAGASLTRVVRKSAVPRIRSRLEALAGLALPVQEGRTVGRHVFSLDGQVLGSVRAVAASTAPSSLGTLEEAARIVTSLVRAIFAPSPTGNLSRPFL